MATYKPPYTITSKIVKLTSEISELISDIKHIDKQYSTLKLRKKNRIRSITGTLQIEGNSFDEAKVTSVINGKTVLGTTREIEEVKGAVLAYDYFNKYDYKSEKDLLHAHKLLMGNLLNNAGVYRQSNVGVGGADGVTHVAPPSNMVPQLMGEIFEWLNSTDEHLLIASCVFHYEFEFIHPFNDGNGRIGRLWQNVILKSFKDLFEHIPIESMIRANQTKYYEALEDAGSAGESTPFIEFMLGIILKSLQEYIKESAKSDQKSKQKSDQKILALMKQNSQITIAEICSKLSMSESGVKKVIKKLKDEDKIKRVGSLKAGHWEVV
ncbi:Fic family protein [Sulfurovum sp. ST-21]|uniref:Fic family protein n=1 Tax=Sulfurovum indicum TaxID=2779528 RepID=A0A7M1S870_9BACT|nr:Fic family protein [Sulfurovum indicum]QOR62929.1 Fic family protein [Sulfurovum indicum]